LIYEKEVFMREYIVRFMLNSKTMETRIRANSATDAKKAVIAQYSGSRVVILNVRDTKTGYYG
jgi:hypothetical protein